MVHQHHSASTVALKVLWHKDVPLKVILFARHLIRDRLPTKDNLFRRGVIASDARVCIGGCGSLETSPRLFLHCGFFGEVWHFIHRWLGVCLAIPSEPANYLNQFGAVSGNCYEPRQSILLLIWYATMWEIWKERDNMIFNGKKETTWYLMTNNARHFSWLTRLRHFLLCGWMRIKKIHFQLQYLVA